MAALGALVEPDDLGWVDGQNIAIDWRFAEGDAQRLRALTAELVRFTSQFQGLCVKGRPAKDGVGGCGE